MIVIDTHIFIWYALNDERLDTSVRKRLKADPDKVLLPSICLWEALMLAERGRISFTNANWGDELQAFARLSRFVEVPLTSQIAILSRTLEFSHEDPADRFIAATAFAFDAELATEDEKLRQLHWVKLAY